MFLTKPVDWVVRKVEALDAAAFPYVTDVVQLAVPGKDPDRYQASFVRVKLCTKSNGRAVCVFVAAVAPRRQESTELTLKNAQVFGRSFKSVVPIRLSRPLFS